MSALLWKYFFEDDVERFRQTLARATYNASVQASKGNAVAKAGNSGLSTSPGTTLATSPTLTSKSRKHSAPNVQGTSHQPGTTKSPASFMLSRTEINWGSHNGVTLLHQIASSTTDNASEFALALLELSLLDLYAQDEESGWTGLHRALYFGNITIARSLMQRDIQGAVNHSSSSAAHPAGGLIKIKDREGYSPFDVYGATITTRLIHQVGSIPLLAASLDDEDNEMAQGVTGDPNDEEGLERAVQPRVEVNGDELFAFGSNKNFTLGFGDEDDRQFPERITLRRPDHLLHRFCQEYKEANPGLGLGDKRRLSDETRALKKVDQMPAIVRYRPIIIQDVQLSKLHSAVLTTDPEANLYMCGFGSGGRLGTGDETTRFGFVNIHSGALMGKKVIHVGLGQDHTIAISSEGETFTWGSNTYGQLGYTSNYGSFGQKDENSLQLLPRQIFGPLKRETVVGAAASRIHSVVHSSNSLYTFGKNEGQLGLVDSDARSLVIQNTPRKVGASLFSSAISSVSAIDKATICLLCDHDVWVFANYGYTRVSFPLEGFSNYFLDSAPSTSRGRPSRHAVKGSDICKITSGGDAICAMTSMGDVFTMHLSQKVETSTASTSTTNPSKIRGALSAPHRVWSLKKGHMAVRDVDVGQDGSIIICTESGSVWQRVKRATIKDATAAGLSEHKAKDYKFSRVPNLTRITAVRSNAFGAFAAVRRDCDVLKTQVDVESNTLWKDLYPLLPFHGFGEEDSDTENPTPRFWTPSQQNDVATIRKAVLATSNLEEDMADFLMSQDTTDTIKCDLWIGTTVSDVRIPLHEFVFFGRSPVMRNAVSVFREAYFFSIPEVMNIEYDKEGKTLVLFQGVDFITILNLVLYLYTDSVVDVWHHTRHYPQSAFRYRQVRTELMKIASHLELRKLEHAARVMTEPPKTLHDDFRAAIGEANYFSNGDVKVELAGASKKVHSALMCQRCPFFEGLFQGRAGGIWISSRREELQEPEDAISVDLKHVDPKIFELVLQHLYADTDERMFDDIVTDDFDGYLDLIMDVMSVANELMLDRLAQCCQKVLGRYVNTRNVCQLLNAVAPCSVTEFKDAALEYICLNLEGMLENHLLDELDDDLVLELDEVVRQNQLSCLPISKSGRAEAELIDQHPELLELRERTKKTKIDQIYLQTKLVERESRFTAGAKAKAALLEEFEPLTSMQKAARRPSHSQRSKSKSPMLKAQNSLVDLMFEMEDSGESGVSKGASSSHRRPPSQSPGLPPSILEDETHTKYDFGHSLEDEPTLAALTSPSSYKTSMMQYAGSASAQDVDDATPPADRKPWASNVFASSKLDMKDIMAQTSSSRLSNISSGFSRSSKQADSSGSSLPGKVSQRERKKQQQQQKSPQLAAAASPNLSEELSSTPTPSSPWQIASRGPKVSLKDVLGAGSSKVAAEEIVPRTPSPMTLRQTISGKPATRRTASGPIQPPATPQSHSVSTQPPATHQNRSVSTPSTSRPATTTPLSSHPPQQIHSIRHTTPSHPASPPLNLSMADILTQQQTEKEIIKEAAAKRSLQEIQEEQAFQEWWDMESRKVRGELGREVEGDVPVGRGRGKGASERGSGREKIRGRRGGRGRGKSGEGGGSGVGVGGSGSGSGSLRGNGRGGGRSI